MRITFAKFTGVALILPMKAFVAFVVILILVIGGGLGFWGWGKLNRVEDWGIALALNSEVNEGEAEGMAERYNKILDQEDILEKVVETHDIEGYYGVSSKAEAVAKLKEDTFVKIHNNRALHVLFTGKRMTRKERLAAVETLATEFRKRTMEIQGN